jgi:hypothetical protein
VGCSGTDCEGCGSGERCVTAAPDRAVHSYAADQLTPARTPTSHAPQREHVAKPLARESAVLVSPRGMHTHMQMSARATRTTRSHLRAMSGEIRRHARQCIERLCALVVCVEQRGDLRGAHEVHTRPPPTVGAQSRLLRQRGHVLRQRGHVLLQRGAPRPPRHTQ